MGKDTKSSSLIRNIVILADFVVLNVLFCLWFYMDHSVSRLPHNASIISPLLLSNVAMVIAQCFFSTVIHDHRSMPERIIRQVTYLVFVQGLANYLLSRAMHFFVGYMTPGVLFIIYFTLILYAGIVIVRFLEYWALKRWRRTGGNTRSVLFVGGDESLLPFYEFLVSAPSTGYRVLGYYADEPMANCPDGLAHCGTLADFEGAMAVKNSFTDTDELYCCLPETASERIINIMRFCNDRVIHFYYIPTVSHTFGYMLKPESIGGMTIFTNYGDPLTNPTNSFIKRAFDIVFSAAVLLCLLPLIPIIAVIIKLQSPGPILFKQARTGLNGSEFMCYKFRSMHINDQADTAQATEHDPRKFAFGNFMRRTNIDELPQFFNVLRGEMSVVGPRPHMLYHTELYRKLIDKYMVRHFVKPGITGWAQVTGFRGETKELWQMEGRVKRDIWYIENWSVWLDIRIVFKTVVNMFVRDKNAY